jgi:hypothetical protein
MGLLIAQSHKRPSPAANSPKQIRANQTEAHEDALVLSYIAGDKHNIVLQQIASRQACTAVLH